MTDTPRILENLANDAQVFWGDIRIHGMNCHQTESMPTVYLFKDGRQFSLLEEHVREIVTEHK